MFMKLRLIPALLAFGLAAPASAGEVVDRIVAVVNADLILLSDLDEAVEGAASDRLRGLSGDERVRAAMELRSEALDFLVDDKLVEQAMERADIVVEGRELEGAIQDVARTNKMTLEQLEEQLGKQGMTMDTYRSEMTDQLRRYKFMNLHIRGRVEISDEQLRSYYKQVMADTSPDPAWRLSRMLLTYDVTAEGAREATMADADAIMTSVQGGGDFAAIAIERSADTSTKERGGDAGVVKAADLSPLWASALRAAKVGDVVRLEAPGGVWLLQIVELANAAVKPFEEVEDELMRILYEEAMEAEMQNWAEEQRAKAHLRLLLES